MSFNHILKDFNGKALEFVHNNNDPSGAKMFNAPSISAL